MSSEPVSVGVVSIGGGVVWVGAGAGVVSVDAGAGVVSIGAGVVLLAAFELLLSGLDDWLFDGAGAFGLCGSEIDGGVAGAVGAGSEVETGKRGPSPVL